MFLCITIAILLVSSAGQKRTPTCCLSSRMCCVDGNSYPGERMLSVAEHYYQFGGKSPINDQNRALIAR